MKPFLEMCIVCHNFQRRLIWSLSSLLQQDRDMSDVLITISSLKDNGIPTTESVVEFFSKKGLNIRQRVYDDRDHFALRGNIRNDDVRLTEATWLFFADADTTYSSDFFEKLIQYLKTDVKDVECCITSIHKRHTRIPETNIIMDNTELIVVEDAHQKAFKIPKIRKMNKRCAAGCMQVTKREFIKDGKYSLNPNDLHLFNQGQKAKSDKQFRRRQGGSYYIDLPVQVHLNHLRDKELKRHIEDQR